MSIRSRRLGSWVFAAICVLFGVLSFVNVFADNKDVEELARGEAKCPKDSCSLVRLERSPFAQQFGFQGKGAIDVTCMRQGILVGPYSCKLSSP